MLFLFGHSHQRRAGGPVRLQRTPLLSLDKRWDSGRAGLPPSVVPIGQPASDESFEVAYNSSSFSRSAMAASSCGERLAHYSGGNGWDQAIDSGLVRSGMTANFFLCSQW